MAETTKTTRRDFLKGRAAAEALGDAVIGTAPPLPPPHSQQESGYLLNVSREAMACEWEILWPDTSTRRASEGVTGAHSAVDAALAALDLIDQLESQLTVYRDTSELMAINRRAAREAVAVEPRLFDLFLRAVELSQSTVGAFDITLGPLSKVWGFFRRQGEMPGTAQVEAARQRVGSQWLVLDQAQQTIGFQQAGMELNLGAIGKGYATDRAAELLAGAGATDFLIHGGHSSVLARGNRISDFRFQISELKQPEVASDAADPQSEIRNLKSEIAAGWSIGLRHPLKPDVRLAEFTLRNQALGTSGSGTQFFHHQGKRYGHVLDPRTGWPADKVLSATVIAPTAELADALSTALFVMGLDKSREFLAKRPECAALFVMPGTRAGSIELHPVNLADEDWKAL